MEVEFSQAEIDKAMKALERGRLTFSKEQAALRRIGNAVIRQARKNVREQRDVNGRAFAPRLKKRKGRRKMLPNIAKKLRSKNNANNVNIGYSNSLTGRIAHTQQHGTPSESWNGERMSKVRGRYRNYDRAPSRRQARMLLKAGYKIKSANGKRWKRPSQKWVIDNLKEGQLFAIWRALTGHEPSTSWEIDNAPRAFLGLPPSQSEHIITREVLRVME
ncbi:hypothetical protein HWQ46_25335 [Shewanella sp. D64]|uniref:hypothetical protein n=1 Tax=unclassified Shewanella TaxID=196818 RepID=UPI0022BA713D|nr:MULTISPECIES: hypothetical protein [unclassified Shewanella]MEC4728842.1 hypothetical protein [Shewanella sp. D64]MEC4740716.1 hypothetical protein [Shewanella sp. E94]WBJ95325.1 hypothetical protein HWQ47_26650 [Shewanella sp. MTB7]